MRSRTLLQALSQPLFTRREGQFRHRLNGVSSITTIRSLLLLHPEILINLNHFRHNKSGNGTQHHPHKEVLIAHSFLYPARYHSGHHHSQRHDSGTKSEMGRLVFPRRYIQHVQRVGRKSKAVAQLFYSHRGNDNPGSRWLNVRQVHIHQVGQIHRYNEEPYQPAKSHSRSQPATNDSPTVRAMMPMVP